MIYNQTKYNSIWDTKKLDDLGVFSRGKSKHRPRNDPKLFENGTHPLVQTGDVKSAVFYISHHEQTYNDFGLSQSKLWPDGTLCITIAANIAETGILAYPMCFPDSVVGFTAYPTETTEAFMHYVFTYIRQSIQNSVTGSIQDNINIDYLKSLDFKIPERPYQDKIVSILLGIDSKIELNAQICSELEAMAKTLYDYWFVQFDFPDENGKPYRTFGGEMVWNEQLKREIPKGWEAKCITEVFDVCYGYPFDTNQFIEEDVGSPVIRIRDILEATVSARTIEKVDEKYWVHSGDLIVGMDGNFHMNFWNGNPALLNQRCFKVSPKEDSVMIAYFSSMPYIKAREKNVTRTTVGHLGADDVKSLCVVCPKEKKMRKYFTYTFDRILEKMCLAREENRELSKLRDWLLPMLMNGQARVE